MPSSCHKNGDYLFDSCAARQPAHYKFNVRPGDLVYLSAANLPAGAIIPIERAVGPLVNDCWAPYAAGGAQFALTEDIPLVTLGLPGWYRIDPSAIPLTPGVEDGCVKVEAAALECHEICAAALPDLSAPPEDPAPLDPPCEVESLTATFVGPGTFSSTDLGATGRIISALVTAGGDSPADTAVVVTGSNGVDMVLGCGDTKGWQEVLDPATQRYCTLMDFEITLAAGETACVVAQAMA